jgi:hypothetical protein
MNAPEYRSAVLSPGLRSLCAISAMLTFYNYLMPWPPTSQSQFSIGFFGVLALSLMAIFGNKLRGARLVAGIAMLVFVVLLVRKLSGAA